MLSTDVHAKPGHIFRRMQQIAVAVFMEECAEFDLTPVQYAALVAIRDFPGIDATRVSALVAFDRSTIGSVLERIEAKGLIERRAGDHDRRVKVLHITGRGRTLLEAIMPAVDRAQERMLAPLAPHERDALMGLLQKLVVASDDAMQVTQGRQKALNAYRMRANGGGGNHV